MKHRLLLILAATATHFAVAQKIDLDKNFVTYQYRGLPHKSLDTTYRTFNVRVEAPSTISSAMSAESIADRILLQGWRKVEYGKGHIQINMAFDDLIFEGQNMSTRVSETKNKDGVVTARTNYYSLTVKYRLRAYYSIRDFNGNMIANQIELNTDRSASWTSSEYTSQYECQNYFNNNRMAISNNLVRKHLDEWTNSVNLSINRDYGFPTLTESALFWNTDSKKHPENAAFNQTITKVKDIGKTMFAYEMPSAAVSGLEECITYFNDIKNKYAGEDKANVKLRYAAYYNIAQIYFMLDKPELALAEADGLEKNEYDVKDAEKIRKNANEMIELFKQNRVHSSHFQIDTNKYKTPSGM